MNLFSTSIVYQRRTIQRYWLQRVGYKGHLYMDTFPRNEDPVREAEYNIRRARALWEKVARALSSNPDRTGSLLCHPESTHGFHSRSDHCCHLSDRAESGCTKRDAGPVARTHPFRTDASLHPGCAPARRARGAPRAARRARRLGNARGARALVAVRAVG